jgi:hypothetical protein
MKTNQSESRNTVVLTIGYTTNEKESAMRTLTRLRAGKRLETSEPSCRNYAEIVDLTSRPAEKGESEEERDIAAYMRVDNMNCGANIYNLISSNILRSAYIPLSAKFFLHTALLWAASVHERFCIAKIRTKAFRYFCSSDLDEKTTGALPLESAAEMPLKISRSPFDDGKTEALLNDLETIQSFLEIGCGRRPRRDMERTSLNGKR